MPDPSTYDPDFFAPLFAIEDRHFWFRARNHLLAAVARQLTAGMHSGYRVLEVGCGTGSVLKTLEAACPDGCVYGMDLYREGLVYARRRVSAPLVQGDVHRPPFAQQFDLIGMFDVLEHLPDDVGVLRDLGKMLAPGGWLMLTVPAYRSLWSYFDEAARHQLRYAPSELRERLLAAGFRVEYLSPYMTLLFPLVWLARRVAARLPGKAASEEQRNHDLTENELRTIPVVNEILAWILSQETRPILARRVLPFGTSLIAIAQKI